jgi:hypothetical protein
MATTSLELELAKGAVTKAEGKGTGREQITERRIQLQQLNRIKADSVAELRWQ